VLRRSMQLDLEPNSEQASRLAQAWRLFFKGVNEQTVRNNSAALFLQQSDDVSLCYSRQKEIELNIRIKKIFCF